jgi:hypothetical protein
VIPTAPPPVEVVLTSRGSTFWLRVKLNFRARLRLYLWMPIPVLGAAWLISQIVDGVLKTHSSGMIFGMAGLVVLALLASLIVMLLLASAKPPPSQVLVPDKLALREDHIKVWPRRGPPFTAEWRHYIVDVVDDAGAYTFKLGKDTPVSFIIPKSALSPHAHALVARWLHQHGYVNRPNRSAK